MRFQQEIWIVAGLKATDLAYNKALGIRDAPLGAAHLLELPYTDLVKNHLGTMHAAAQFSLAEAASAECLQRNFGTTLEGRVTGVVRGVAVKYRRPASGELHAFGTPDPHTKENLLTELTQRGRALAMILVDLKETNGTLTFHGKFEWFISLIPLPPSLR